MIVQEKSENDVTYRFTIYMYGNVPVFIFISLLYRFPIIDLQKPTERS